jgi:hypothetical protein
MPTSLQRSKEYIFREEHLGGGGRGRLTYLPAHPEEEIPERKTPQNSAPHISPAAIIMGLQL